MREYARIEQKKTVVQPQGETKPKPRKEEVDFDISREDLTDEFSIL